MSPRLGRPEGDDGVAALEMALVTTLLMVLAFSALPLFSMMRSYQRVNAASADAVRFATSVDANGRRQADGTLRRRPSAAEVVTFARDSADDQTLSVIVKICPASTPDTCTAGDPLSAQSGDTIEVTVSQTVDLSLLGSVANAAANLVGQGDVAPEGNHTLTSTARGREE